MSKSSHSGSVAELLRSAAMLLGSEGHAEAALLLGRVLSRPRSWLMAFGEYSLDATEREQFDALVDRRIAGEPIAYIVGTRGFWRFDLSVSPDTLIPRPDTERLVELALEWLPSDVPLRVLDLGTGSGAIALALALERPLIQMVAVERSAAAASVARRNTAALGLAERVEVREGDWFAPVAGEVFDLIVSNPPYIEADDPHLATGDLRFEPRSALASGADGLDDLRHIVGHARPFLRPGAALLVEHGWQQGAAVRALFLHALFDGVRTEQDLEGRDRVTLGVLRQRDPDEAFRPS